MAKLYNMSKNDYILLNNNIAKNLKINLAAKGLLLTLWGNKSKKMEELVDELPDNKVVIETALQLLKDEGYIYEEKENNETVYHVSDIPEFLGGIAYAKN